MYGNKNTIHYGILIFIVKKIKNYQMQNYTYCVYKIFCYLSENII